MCVPLWMWIAPLLLHPSLHMEDPLLAVTLENMATICRDLGQTDNALALQGRVTEIRKNAFGIRHLDYAKSVYNLGASVRCGFLVVVPFSILPSRASPFSRTPSA